MSVIVGVNVHGQLNEVDFDGVDNVEDAGELGGDVDNGANLY